MRSDMREALPQQEEDQNTHEAGNDALHKTCESFAATANSELRLFFALGGGSDLFWGQGSSFNRRFWCGHGGHDGVA